MEILYCRERRSIRQCIVYVKYLMSILFILQFYLQQGYGQMSCNIYHTEIYCDSIWFAFTYNLEDTTISYTLRNDKSLPVTFVATTQPMIYSRINDSTGRCVDLTFFSEEWIYTNGISTRTLLRGDSMSIVRPFEIDENYLGYYERIKVSLTYLQNYTQITDYPIGKSDYIFWNKEDERTISISNF